MVFFPKTDAQSKTGDVLKSYIVIHVINIYPYYSLPMLRQFRIDVPGALRHIIVRVNEKKSLKWTPSSFLDMKQDKKKPSPKGLGFLLLFQSF